MILLAEYVGPWAGSKDWTPEHQRNAVNLLKPVNHLLARYEAETGGKISINPATKSQVSGSVYGGFRPLSCRIGSSLSSHKEARGVDVFDEGNLLDLWLTDEILEQEGLYREHPSSTYLGSDGKPHPWCHLTDRAPPSGHRTFYP